MAIEQSKVPGPQRLGKVTEAPVEAAGNFELRETDRPDLTTTDEQKEYDDMIEKDFIKIDPKSSKPVAIDIFYKVLHVYPQFKSANPAEYKARFFIEEFEYMMNPDGSKRRQVRTSFDMFAKDFKANFQPTIVESIASMSRLQPR